MLSMAASETRDRRQYPRFPHPMKLLATELPQSGSFTQRKTTIKGSIENISRGGICVLSDRSIPNSALVRCEFLLSDVPIPVPTLMQVRWTRKHDSREAGYISGLHFLL
jgi:hypothetical protein